jgi:hypothetical protein
VTPPLRARATSDLEAGPGSRPAAAQRTRVPSHDCPASPVSCLHHPQPVPRPAGRPPLRQRVRPEPIPTQARASTTGSTSTGQQKADELAARLNTFADDLRRRPGLPVSQTLRQETQLLLRFRTVRARFVADLVHAGLGMPGLRDSHPELAIIGHIYAHDSASLPGFQKSVEDQIATQSVVDTDRTAQEDYCSKAFLCC